MRAHPVGMAFAGDFGEAFRIGHLSASLTHGHPRATLPAGMFAVIIAELLAGKSIDDAVTVSIRLLRNYDNYEDTLATLQEALNAVESTDADLDYIKSTEGGWRGDTALVISLCCFLRHRNDPLEALIASVNHSGDWNNTGTICGAMLGAVYDPD